MKKIINKWRNLPDSIKSSIVFAISSFFIKGIAFIVTPIFTRIMLIDDFGKVTAYNSWVSIIEIFALLGLTSAGVFNVGLKDHKKDRDQYISSTLGLCNFITIIVFIVLLLLKDIIGSGFLIDTNLLVIMFIHFLFNPALIFWITRQKYEYKYKLAFFITVFSVLIGQIISIMGVFIYKNNTAFAKIFGYEFGFLLFCIPIYIILIKKGKSFYNFKNWKSILILAIPLIPHYLAQHLMASVDKIMISKMVGNGAAAIYGVVASISLIGTIVWNAINGSLVPYTFEKIENNKEKEVIEISKILILSYAVICILIMLVSPEIMKIMAPQEYYEGVFILPPMLCVVFLQAAYNLYANVEFYYKSTNTIARATVVAAIVNLVLNYLFIPIYGYLAAAYTTLISYVVLIVIHYFGYKKCTKDDLYDNKQLFCSFIILIIFAIICSGLYNLYFLIRYLIIAIILLISIIFRKKIIKVLKEL